MKQVFYRLKHKDGKFFNGFRQTKMFDRDGKYFSSLEDLYSDVARVMADKRGKTAVERFFDQVEFVREEHEVAEAEFDGNSKEFIERMSEQARIIDILLSKSRKEYLYRGLVSDLQALFPTWKLNGLIHIAYIDGYKLNPANSLNGAAIVAKQLGLKRPHAKFLRNTIAVDDESYITWIKLGVPPNTMFHLDLSTL